MTAAVFEYQGYLGSAEVDREDNVLTGRLLFMRDVIAYSASTPAELETAFHQVVDEYLEACVGLGDEPDTPCKGTFNVRIGPERHREAALAARRRDVSLNDFVGVAIDAAIADQRPVTHLHKHEVKVFVSQPPVARIAGASAPDSWETTIGHA